MRYEVRVGERTVRVELAPDGSTLVDDAVAVLEAQPSGDDGWWIRLDGAAHEVRVIGRDPLRLWVDGTEVACAVDDERTVAAQRAGGGARAGRHELRAPMPGLLKAVHVAEGDSVEAGTALVTLEAMKMENELRAPAAGRVARVAAGAGTKVDGGALLVVITE